MNRLQRIAAALMVFSTFAPVATAQPPAAPRPEGRAVRAPDEREAAGASASAPASPRYRRRSIVHHYPHPYPEYYHGEQTAGFRNPGGTGRYAEYYPPGDQFQTGPEPVRAARFDQGGAPGRAEQIQAGQVGIQRQNSIQNHIDNYARPSFGVGFFGGYY